MAFFAQAGPDPYKQQAGQIGQALGLGINKNFPDPQQLVQRSLVKDSLKELQSLANNPNATPFDLATSLISATAGIPGAERYVPTLFEQLMKGNYINKAYGNDRGGVGAGQSQGDINQSDIINQDAQSPFQQYGHTASKLGQQKPQVTGVNQGESVTDLNPSIAKQEPRVTIGVLPRIKPVAEVEEEARRRTQASMDPNTYSTHLSNVNTENSLANQAVKEAESKALSLGISESELPDFMRIGQKHAQMSDLNQWANVTNKDFKGFKNKVKQLENAFFPGFWTGLTGGSEKRQQALDRLNVPVKNLVDAGFEDKAREKLAMEDLSPTEIEERIHPIDNKIFLKIPTGPFTDQNKPSYTLDFSKGYPQAPLKAPKTLKTYDELAKDSPQTIEYLNNKITKFLKENLTKDMSLSVIRHKLWADKGYDWRQFAPAVQKLIDDGFELSQAQQAELSEISTNPPRQSLSEIWSRPESFIPYIKGKK